jgi:inorganic pyrophosphatase
MSTDDHPWHQVSPGDNIPDLVNAIIEIPKGSKAKYEIDKASGLIKLDRVLFSSVMYPANYGFIPQTYCDDKDPLDILAEMQKGIPAIHSKKTQTIEDRHEAILAAVKMAKPEDIILVAGKGHETYQEIKGVKHHFDDKEVLREAFGE